MNGLGNFHGLSKAFFHDFLVTIRFSEPSRRSVNSFVPPAPENRVVLCPWAHPTFPPDCRIIQNTGSLHTLPSICHYPAWHSWQSPPIFLHLYDHSAKGVLSTACFLYVPHERRFMGKPPGTNNHARQTMSHQGSLEKRAEEVWPMMRRLSNGFLRKGIR